MPRLIQRLGISSAVLNTQSSAMNSGLMTDGVMRITRLPKRRSMRGVARVSPSDGRAIRKADGDGLMAMRHRNISIDSELFSAGPAVRHDTRLHLGTGRSAVCLTPPVARQKTSPAE
jgi:hypothetical protein